MVSISLFVELLRTRPLSLFWTMAALQAVLWTLVPALFYSAPPGQLPVILAIGHEFQLGTDFGPPLAFWLGEIAYRVAGLFGVYLLSQICIVVTFWAVLTLGRAMVGVTHAVMAVLLMAGIAVFSVPTPEFGPAILATPLWALLLLHYWRAAQNGEWGYWLAVGLEAGLLLLTTYAGLILVGLLVLFLLSSPYGRRHLETVGPWVAGLLCVVILFPYLIWLDLGGGTKLPDVQTMLDNLRSWGRLLAALLISHAGIGILAVLGRGYLIASRGPPPEVSRPPVEPAARNYVYYFALAPVVAMGLFALISHRPENFVAAPLVVMSGLAVMVAAGDRIRIEHQYLIGYVWAALLLLPPLLVALAIVIQPWIFAIDLRVGRPAVELGHYFGDSFQRRTGKPLAIVAGDRSIASLVSLMAPSRPSLYLESAPEYLPRVTKQDIADKGAVVLWPISDTTGRPPAEIQRQFPGLVPEVAPTFSRRFQGRMPLLRVGWGVIRPGTPASVLDQPAQSPPPQTQPEPQPQVQPTPQMPVLPPSTLPPEVLPQEPQSPVQPPPRPEVQPREPSPQRQQAPAIERHAPQ